MPARLRAAHEPDVDVGIPVRRLSLRRVGELYSQELSNARRELLFVSGVSFFVSFGVTRGIAHAILREYGPFRNVRVRGLHIHHHVLGVLMLIGSGHAWLHLASMKRRDDRRLLRLTTVVYATGSALTLDELALVLNLQDVYWESPGREIIDGGILVISLASIGAWGAPFFAALVRELKARDDDAADGPTLLQSVTPRI
ncbi:MAG: hypothetical protein ABR564_09135 [Candidatus Dormibacteria bacterium]